MVNGGSGAGAVGGFLANCTINNNTCNGSGATVGGGVSGSVVTNCMFSGNAAKGAGASGGAAYNSVLNNCTLVNNSADYGGGGAYNCSLTNCTVANNKTSYSGGGVTGCTLNNCVVSGNNSGYGGGANYNCLMINCSITGNYASYGGGVYNGCTLYNCLVTGNTAGGYGGGAYGCTLNNCTVSGNTAQLFGGYGGGAYSSTLNNSIIYYNTGGASGPDIYSCTLNYSCAPTATGPGNVTNAPLFMNQAGGDFHLQAGSPCINAGANSYVGTSTDRDGNLRIAGPTVDMGAYEFQPAGPLTVALQATLTNAPVSYPVNFTGIFSKGQSNFWSFGDGTFASNQLSATHSWASAGDYPVMLTAYDVATPGGVSASLTIHVKTQIVYYVNVAGTSPFANPLSPYDSWNTAATNIQDAIDAALPIPQSLVLVTNGTYQTGGRITYGSMSNRVVINKPISVRSVNGPAVTVIQGNPVIGDTGIRCAYVTNNAVLAGFTLANGATRNAGDVTREESGGGVWCESTTAVVSNCMLIGNSAAVQGGGIYGGTLNRSTICSNRVAFTPGTGNGGGVSSATLNSCVLFDNLANASGGGAWNSTLNGCSLTRNQSSGTGGGAYGGTLNNCTLTGNSADTGGGVASATLNNCIAFHNSAPYGPNYSGSTLNFCCTIPLPDSGDGNITADPRLTDSAHISAGSPCRGAGSTNYLSGLDVDGEAWLNPPSIGADEFYPGFVTGTLSVSATVAYTNAAAGFPVACAGTILIHAISNIWNFGDGTSETNQLFVSHSWTSNGTYQVVLAAYNDTNPGGINATNTVHVLVQPVHYVSPVSATPIPPYFSWANAATNIQDAVDVAYGGGTVLVTNGLYQTGARIAYGSLSNRVAVMKAITVKSVNGPAFTTIQGYQVPGTTNDDAAVRCVYLTNDTVLSGFTISHGATRAAGDRLREQSGGGVFCQSSVAVVTNCVLTGNAAYDSAGGCYQGTINNCSFIANWAWNGNWNGFDHAGGGGALEATLNNCVLSNNWVVGNTGGGVSWCVVSNCILSGNTAYYGGGANSSTLNNTLVVSNNAPGAGGGLINGSAMNCTFRYNSSWWGAGADAATLENCLIVSNAAAYIGGGVISCTANNCTVIGNSAGSGGGGGANSSTLNNCIVYYNFATTGSNFIGSSFNYCCTSPDPGGPGNTTVQPGFADQTSGDFRLAANSACINAGRNMYVTTTKDLDGNPRIAGGTVDIGAFEYPLPTSILSYAWAQQYGLAIDGSADFTDADGDGVNNYGEWVADTVPTNAASVFRIVSITNGAAGVTVTWWSVATRSYWLERATNLEATSPFQIIATNIPGVAGVQSYTDATTTNRVSGFYRVGVQ